MSPRRIALATSLLLLAACAPVARKAEAPPAPASVPTTPPPPLRFAIAADPNDAWNAVGQILVRTPGVAYDSRSQMLGLYALRYRGEPLLVLTRGVPASDTVTTLTTEVSTNDTQGKAATSAAAADLLALLQRELPAEIDTVKARFAAQKAAAAAKAHGGARKSLRRGKSRK